VIQAVILPALQTVVGASPRSVSIVKGLARTATCESIRYGKKRVGRRSAAPGYGGGGHNSSAWDGAACPTLLSISRVAAIGRRRVATASDIVRRFLGEARRGGSAAQDRS
jgi:hypothetical protein